MEHKNTNNMQKFMLAAICAAFLFFSTCTKENTDPIADVDCSTVTFSATIFPIFEQNCNTSGCHGSGAANGVFSDYDAIKVIADNGKLRTEVLDDRTMPIGSTLTSEELGQIKCWLDAGAPE
jgi:mono/diheme cytochrome c family protein